MSSPDPNREMVDVFDTQQESEAWVVKGLLESAGIDAVEVSLDAPQDVLPGVGGVVIRVPPQQAEEARAIIAASQKPASASPPGAAANDDSVA